MFGKKKEGVPPVAPSGEGGSSAAPTDLSPRGNNDGGGGTKLPFFRSNKASDKSSAASGGGASSVADSPGEEDREKEKKGGFFSSRKSTAPQVSEEDVARAEASQTTTEATPKMGFLRKLVSGGGTLDEDPPQLAGAAAGATAAIPVEKVEKEKKGGFFSGRKEHKKDEEEAAAAVNVATPASTGGGATSSVSPSPIATVPVPVPAPAPLEKEKKSGGFFSGRKEKPSVTTSSSTAPLTASGILAPISGGYSASSNSGPSAAVATSGYAQPAQDKVPSLSGGSQLEVKQLQKSAAKHKKKNKTVEMVRQDRRSRMARGVGADGVVILAPEVLRVKVLEVDAKKIPADWQLFLSLGWRMPKNRKACESKTPCRAKPWNFYDCDTIVLDLMSSDLAAKPIFFVELWAYGRVKNSLEGSVELPLNVIKTMVGEFEVQRERRLLIRSEDKKEVVANLRLGLEIGRSDASILRHLGEGIVRLAQSERGKEKQSELWPQTEEALAPVRMAARRSVLISKMLKLGNEGDTAFLPQNSQLAPPPCATKPETSPPPAMSPARLRPSPLPSPRMPLLPLVMVPAAADPEKSAERDRSSEPDPTASDESSDVERGGYDRPAEELATDSGYLTRAASIYFNEGPEGGAGMYNQPEETFSEASDLSSDDELVASMGPKSPGRSSANHKPAADILKTPADLLFNDEWQKACEQLATEESPEMYETLSDLSRKFVAVAQTYGRIIVRELHYPVERKLIKPMDLGGVIGGEKFVIAGILFKVAKAGLFGDDAEPSQKIAGHELKTLTALFNANQIAKIGMALPMIALLDVLGHRLIALALCPLDSRSIIHGSSDAAVTIHSDPEAGAKLLVAAKHLNLKVHSVQGHAIPLAVDTEVHRGHDGRMYVIDLSRVLPPEQPDRKIHLSHLYRMLRPELVRTNPESLCADAASNFVNGESDARDHVKGISEATTRLKKILIPWAAVSLDQLHGSRDAVFFYSVDHIHRVLHVVHALGVNFRFLLEVRAHSQQLITLQLLLVETASRAIKKEIRKLLRSTLASSNGIHDVDVARNVIHYCNVMFSEVDNAAMQQERESCWNKLAEQMQKYYGPLDRTTPEPSRVTGKQLRDDLLAIPLGMLLIFLRLSEQLGLQWAPRVSQLVENSLSWLEDHLDDRDDGARSRSIVTSVLTGTTQVLKGVGHTLTGNLFRGGSHKRQNSMSKLSSEVPVPSTPSPRTLSSIQEAADKEEDDDKTTPEKTSAGASQAQAEALVSQSPWTFWAKNSASLFFDDDLLDVGFRVKNNNMAAMAQGRKLLKLSQPSETPDPNLRAHFRHLAGRFFNAALMSNPSNPVTLRLQAQLLLDEEKFRAGAEMLPVSSFWSSSLRYIDFLYKIALDSDPNDSFALLDYSRFLAYSGGDRAKRAFFLLRAVAASHKNTEAIDELRQMLVQLNLGKELRLLELWLK